MHTPRLQQALGWLYVSIAVAMLTSFAAQAAPVSVVGQGQVVPTGNGGPNNALELAVPFSTYTFTDANGQASQWDMTSVFLVDGLAIGQPGPSHGQGQFFNNTGDALFFTFVGLPIGGNNDEFVYGLDYTFTGGSGVWLNVGGTGVENVTINRTSFAFTGSGQLQLAVPEPAALALVLPGLLGLVLSSRRRARTTVRRCARSTATATACTMARPS